MLIPWAVALSPHTTALARLAALAIAEDLYGSVQATLPEVVETLLQAAAVADAALGHPVVAPAGGELRRSVLSPALDECRRRLASLSDGTRDQPSVAE